jgi:hypothetical protein
MGGYRLRPMTKSANAFLRIAGLLLGSLLLFACPPDREEAELREALAARPERIGPCSLETESYNAAKTRLDVDSPTLVRSWLGRAPGNKWEASALRSFTLLRENYAGYDLFGGDERFKAAFGELLDWTGVEGEGMTSESYAKHLAEALAFVSDAHFTVESGDWEERLADMHRWYTTGDRWLLERSGKAFTFMGGEYRGSTFAPESKTGEDIRVVPSIAEDGSLAYRLVFPRPVAREPGDNPSTVTVNLPIETRGRGDSAAVSFVQVWGREGKAPEDPWIIEETAYGSYVGYHDFSMKGKGNVNWEPRQAAFVATADSLRKAESLVFDLRSNPGGSDQYLHEWVKRFSGSELPVSIVGGMGVILGKVEMDDSRWKRLSASLGPDGRFARIRGPNKALVVIMNGGCCSTAEEAIRELSLLDTCLLVGMPSAGMARIGSCHSYFDGESGVRMYFGNWDASWYPEAWRSRPEGQGIEPDLWVPTWGARERAEAFIRHYGPEKIEAVLRDGKAAPARKCTG